jgi:hypothetical protein
MSSFIDYFKIQDKNGKKTKYIPNRAQLDYREKCKQNKKILVLKARQLGITTETKLDDLDKMLSRSDFSCISITHKLDDSQKIFEKIHYAFNMLPSVIRDAYLVRYSGRTELEFGLGNSKAHVSVSARSQTYQKVHVSEFAFFDKQQVQETRTGTFEAVPKEGQIIIESTGRGQNHFKEMWDEAVEMTEQGKPDWLPLFYNWTWEEGYSMEVPENYNLKKEYAKLIDAYGLISDIQEKFHLTNEQLYWYIKKATDLKEFIKQEYPTTPREAFIASSHSFFDLEIVDQIKTIEPTGELGQYPFIVDIFKKPDPKKSYAIGVDTSNGEGQGDSSTIEVICIEDLEEVASFESKSISPKKLAELSVGVAEFYNHGFLVPENNNVGFYTTNEIIDQYSWIYKEEVQNRTIERTTDKYGFNTNTKTRPQMIHAFKEVFESGLLIINSHRVKSQMMTFVTKDNGKVEHEDGKHDDSLFALMLAFMGREQTKYSMVLFSGK